MTTDAHQPGDLAPLRIAVTSPSGIPGSAWVWPAPSGDPEGVAIARMTLEARGDRWVRAEVQEPLPTDVTPLLQPPLEREPRTRVPRTAPDVPVSGPIAHDAELEPLTSGAPPTRLACGRVTLLGTGPSGTHRAHLEIVALRRRPDGATIVIDLRGVFRWPDPRRLRLLLAVDDEARVEDQDSTLTTPAKPSGATLPFRGSQSPAATAPSQPSAGLPFPGSTTPTRAASTPVAPPFAAGVSPPPMQHGSTHGAQALVAPLAPTSAPHSHEVARDVARPPMIVVPAAQPETATEASNRAAGASAGATTSTPAPASTERGRGLELLWHEARLEARLRTVPAWRKLLRDAEGRVPSSDHTYDVTTEEETRWAVTQLLRDAAPTPAAGFRARLASAFLEPGVVKEPIVRVRGALRIDFDPRARLAAACAATRTLARGDAKFAEAWRPASELSTESDPLTPQVELEEAEAGLRAAFANSNRSITTDELDRRIETSLVARRAFHVVELGGSPHVRGRLSTEDGATATVYLPDACARAWPLAARLEVEAIVALVPPRELALDESHAAMVLALARRAPSGVDTD